MRITHAIKQDGEMTVIVISFSEEELDRLKKSRAVALGEVNGNEFAITLGCVPEADEHSTDQEWDEAILNSHNLWAAIDNALAAKRALETLDEASEATKQ